MYRPVVHPVAVAITVSDDDVHAAVTYCRVPATGVVHGYCVAELVPGGQ